MPGPDDESPQNPIVALATRLRNRRAVEQTIDGGAHGGASAADAAAGREASDAEGRLAELGAELQRGSQRLNAILGKRDNVKFIRLERPLRLRLRFGEKRISLDLDLARQLVLIAGEGFDGEYQFDPAAQAPSLLNLSLLSTEAGYGEPVTASSLLKTIARDAELPRPAHLDGAGPLSL